MGKKLDTSDTENPVEQAIECVRNGDIDAARKILGVTPEEATDEEFFEGLQAYDLGMELFQQQQHAAAVGPLRQVVALFQHADDPGVRMQVNFIHHLAEGIALFATGNTHAALEFFQNARDMVRQVPFPNQALKKVAAYFHLVCLMASARAALSSMDLPNAKKILAEAHQQGEQFLKMVDPGDKTDVALEMTVYAERILAETGFALLDFNALNGEDASARLDNSLGTVKTLEKLLAAADPGSQVRGAAEMAIGFYWALEGLNRLVTEIVVRRGSLTQDRAKRLEAARKRLKQVEDLSEKMGPIGNAMHVQAVQLERYARNLPAIGGATKQDFGRFSGMLSLVSMIVLLFVTKVVFDPSGAAAMYYYLTALAMGLIVGFGLGALRFIPLFRAMGDIASAQKQGAKT